MIINIIAVDDEINILNDMKRILGRIPGTQVEGGFTSSLEALKFVNKKPIDVAVLDIDMPELNGIELAGMLRNIYPEVQIIFLPFQCCHPDHLPEDSGLHGYRYRKNIC